MRHDSLELECVKKAINLIYHVTCIINQWHIQSSHSIPIIKQNKQIWQRMYMSSSMHHVDMTKEWDWLDVNAQDMDLVESTIMPMQRWESENPTSQSRRHFQLQSNSNSEVLTGAFTLATWSAAFLFSDSAWWQTTFSSCCAHGLLPYVMRRVHTSYNPRQTA